MSIVINRIERNSAVELLRIVSMLFVIVLHFNRWGINQSILEMTGRLTLENSIGHLVESLTIVAVDVFVLISGYFGIRFKLKGILRLFLICFTWGLLSYLLYCIFGQQSISLKKLLARFLAFTHNKWWFIIAYLYLYLASPLLNAAIEKLRKHDFLVILLLYSISTIYIGYFRDMGDNRIGMSFVQFVFLYLLGRFIHNFYTIESFRKNRWKYVILYLLFTLSTFSLALANQKWLHLSIPFLRPYPYNSPLIIGASICLLCFSLSFSFYNKFVNLISGSVLCAYLLQDSSYFGYLWLYPTINLYLNEHSLPQKYFLLFFISIVFLCVCLTIDLLIRILFYNPVLGWYERVIESHNENTKGARFLLKWF